MIYQLFQDLFTKYVDVQLAVLIVVSAYFFCKYLCDSFLPTVSKAHKVLLWSTLISVAYYLILQKTGAVKEQPVVIYLITYFFSTSFYELLFRPLQNWLQKETGTVPAE